jgi:5,10-methylenetetrahydromethanopterin reductase
MTPQVSIAFQTDKTAACYRALAKQVDHYAFDAVSVYCDAPYHPSFGPLMLMAPHLHKARIGPAAVSPFRIHPIDIAAETALLADLAKGKIYLGLARGAWLADHGIHEPGRPIQAIKEAIEIVRLLLRGQAGGYNGQVFKIASHVRAPYPLPEAEIPIMIGTWGQRLARLAGEMADEVKVGGSANPDFVPVIRRFISEGEKLAGRNAGQVKLVMGAVSLVDDDRGLARRAARQALALYLPVVAPLDSTVQVEPGLLSRIQSHLENGETSSAADLISDDLLERFALAGNPADLIRQAEGLFAAGVDRIEFGTPHGLKSEEGIRLLGEKVLPALKSLHG